MLITVNDELIESVTLKNESKTRSTVQFQSAMDLFVGKKGKGSRYGKQPIITATLANKDDWTGECKLQYTKSNKGTLPRVECTVLDKSDTNYSCPVYIVAVPFNGILDAIKPSNGYRIHRGFIGKAKRKEIVYNDETYTKVVFMVVTPNVAMFKKTHKNHVESIDLEVVSYNLNSTESGDSKTVKSTATISFTAAGADFSIVTEDWHAVDPKDLNTAKSYIFPIFNGLDTLKKRKAGNPSKNNTERDKVSKKTSEHLTQKINVPKLDDMLDKFNRDSSEKQADLRKRNEK